MEEWHADVDQVGERCGYCHEGIVEEGEPAYPTTPEGVFDLAKQVFPETSSFDIAGWILPDGTLLALTYGGGKRDRDHGEVARLFEEPTERWEAVNKFRDMGAIRTQPYRGGGYAIEMSVMPSQEQLKQIRRLLETAQELEVEVFTTGRNGKFFQEYPRGTMMEEVYRDIKAEFAGGRSELMRFHNSSNWYKSASAIPRGTFEPLQDMTERLSSSLDTGADLVDALKTMRELLRPLSNFRHIAASVDSEADSIILVDDENEEACAIRFEKGATVVESIRFERLDKFQKAASTMQVCHEAGHEYNHDRSHPRQAGDRSAQSRRQ